MDIDAVRKMAKAAKIPLYMRDTEGGLEALGRLVELAAKQERERCASISDQRDPLGTTAKAIRSGPEGGG